MEHLLVFFVSASCERWLAQCAPAFRWTSGLIVCDLRLSGCLLSWITFWHSSLLSQTLRYLGPRVDGGPNDKASLTISRQEQGGERGKLNCQREKRREEEWRREEGRMEVEWWGCGGVTPSCKMEPVIICSFGAHQALPSVSNAALLTSLPLFHPLLFLLSPPSLIFHFTFLLPPTTTPPLATAFPPYFRLLSLTVHAVWLCSLFNHAHSVAIRNIILIKCINWWFEKKKKKLPRGFKSLESGEKELTRPRPEPALPLWRMWWMVMLMLNKQRGF